MADVLRAKVGGTFSLDCTRTDAAGDPVSLSGVTIEADLLYGGTRIPLSSAVVDAAAGTFTLSKPAADMAVAAGVYAIDVFFTNGAVVDPTETFFVNIADRITE